MLGLTKVKIGIILSLLIALSLLGWQYRAEVRSAAQQAQTIAQHLSTIGSLSQRLQALEEQHAKTMALITESNTERLSIQDYYRRSKLNEDAEYTDWASSPLPDSVKRMQYSGTDGD